MVSSPDNIIKYRVEIAPKAKEDLHRVYEFLKEATESTYIADKQAEIIRTGILKLSIFPNGCPKYSEKYSYRVCHIKKYSVLFDIDDKKHIVNIARVFHVRENTKTTI